MESQVPCSFPGKACGVVPGAYFCHVPRAGRHGSLGRRYNESTDTACPASHYGLLCLHHMESHCSDRGAFSFTDSKELECVLHFCEAGEMGQPSLLRDQESDSFPCFLVGG